MTESEVRNDWFEALSNVEKGTQLSGIIKWGFSDQDLMVLYCLHQAGFFKEKIEDLLEDCNFHTECGLLAKGKYKECLEEIMDSVTSIS